MICNCDSVGRTNATWKSVTHKNAHNAYCLLEECFRLYSLQALESVGVARVHQEAWAWSQFQVVELLRYFYTNISLIKKQYLLSPPVFQIRVMITYFRYIVTSLTSTSSPLLKSLNIHTYTG